MLKFITDVFKFATLLLYYLISVIDDLTFVNEALILVKALLNDALSNITESTVLETLESEVLRIATFSETLAPLQLRFKYPFVAVSVFKVGITVILFVFSRLLNLKKQFVIDK